MALPAFPPSSEAHHDEGFLHSRDNLRLYWQRYTPPTPRATVAVFPGGGDHGARYPGVTAALVRAGFEVALLDFRGHGQSDGRRFYIDSYRDYLDDADAFVAHLRAGAAGRKLFVVAHSQGGLIATLWALAAPRQVSGFVLSSPFFRLKLQPPMLKVMAARLVGGIIPWLPIATGLRPEVLTSDPEMQRWIAADPLYGRAATPRWLLESQRVQADIVEDAKRFEHPLLVLTGTGDTIADAGAARAFFEGARSSDKQLLSYEGFQHELYNERERERPIGDTVAWIEARSA
jgi:alpha-beta hydrolase superfamily lysophospholipase